MNTFTPGPWRRGKYKVFSEDESLVAHTRSTGLASDADEANARLIASAPDLLEALQMIYSETADYIRLNNLGGIDNQCMQLSRAAIAKATGEGA
jgi:hypothetical protein